MTGVGAQGAVSHSPYIMKDERPCGEASSLGVPVNFAQDEARELKRRTPLPKPGKGVRVDSLLIRSTKGIGFSQPSTVTRCSPR